VNNEQLNGGIADTGFETPNQDSRINRIVSIARSRTGGEESSSSTESQPDYIELSNDEQSVVEFYVDRNTEEDVVMEEIVQNCYCDGGYPCYCQKTETAKKNDKLR
jgi:hypothetical protein